MTYSEYEDHLKVCRYLGKPLTGKFKYLHDSITTLWAELECGHDPMYLGILFKKNNDILFLDNIHKDTLWCFRRKVWDTFRERGHMTDEETGTFLKDMMEDHLRSRIGTPELF